MGQYTKLLQLNPVELTGLKLEELYNRFYPNDTGSGDKLLDIDKSLPGIQFLLSGSAGADNPYQNLLKGKIVLLPQDEENGIIYQVLTHKEIEQLDELLSTVNDSILAQNFDPLVMMASDVYPNIWGYGKESYDYLHTCFLGLKKFISQAARDAKAIVIMTT